VNRGRFSNGPEKAQIVWWQETKKIEKFTEAKKARRESSKEEATTAQCGRET
jgi:hypothetical protein